MKFIADCMLGRLAKWLRILGYDTLYYRKISDEELLQKALQTDRILLTRDTALFKIIPPDSGLFITSDQLEEQLQQIVLALNLKASQSVLSRCVECNTSLERVEKVAVASCVPEFIYHTHNDFSRCPHCGKVYWKGSHQTQILKKLKTLFKNQCQS